MIRTELFKLRAHRTPWTLLAMLTASLLIGPIYYAIRNPPDPSSVIESYVGVFTVMAPLLATVFGGWIVGHEFRQGTMRRVLGNDARRGRLIAVKAAVGVGALAGGLAIAAGLGALASILSVSTFDGSIVWDDVGRELLSGGFLGLAIASVSFGLSILLRSDTYSMLGAIGLMMIVGPLLTLIPKVGKYVPSALANDVSAWIAGADDATVSIGPAALGLAASVAALSAAATFAFQHRDV